MPNSLKKQTKFLQVEEEEKSNEGWKWNKKSSCIYGDGGTTASEKIASFDMDWTLIRTKSGATFPKHADDWELWDKSVATKLKELYDDNYKILIFSNQGGIGNGKQKEGDIKKKIQAISKLCGVPMQAFMSTQEDSYKKPSSGMWDFFVDECNENIKIDKKASMYVGDAAGRKKPQVAKNDFSDSDLKFAHAIGLPFFTPEQFFLKKKETIAASGWDPKKVGKQTQLFKEKDAVLKLNKQEMIVFCGSSSSGKSTFCTNHLDGYIRVNRDTLKTKEKCYKAAEEALSKKQSVVIDNTSPSVEDRAYFLKLAKQYSIPARCFYFEAEKDMCFFLNEQRVINTERVHLSGKVPKIPIHSFFKNHVKPTVSEGFQAVQTVNFVPGPFVSNEDENKFYVFGK